MGPNFGPSQDAQSQAYFRSAQSGNEASSIPGQVDQESIVHTVDAGTSIPATVDSGLIPSKVDRPG